MGEQRRGRGGRGRSGRGGRIPRKGEGQHGLGAGESFVSFPLDITGPIRVASPLDDAGVGGVLRETLTQERAYVATLEKLRDLDGGLQKVLVEAQRHRDVLEQLARDLGAGSGDAPAAEAGGSPRDLISGAQRCYEGWQTLQRAAYMFGDKRIDRVVKPALREKARHLDVLETVAVREASRVLVREMEF